MTEHDSYLATGFRDVDNNSDIGKLEACLRFVEDHRFVLMGAY